MIKNLPSKLALFCLLAAMPALARGSELITLEPDDYPANTVLNTILPGVTLSVVNSQNVASSGIDVTATVDSMGGAPTGTTVFGQGGVYFWNSAFRLKMTFTDPVATILLPFSGGTPDDTNVGQIDAFSKKGVLLASYTTQPRSFGSAETMKIVRQSADIAYAVAYIPANKGSFGILDKLQFDALPLPSTFFEGQAPLGSGAYYLQFPSGNPFGYYSYLTDPDYIYHFDMGYEYIFDAADGNNGVYFYDFTSSTFFYTSPSFPFPYLYDFSLNTVLYYFPDPNNPGHYNTDGYRFFYRFDTGQIFVK